MAVNRVDRHPTDGPVSDGADISRYDRLTSGADERGFFLIRRVLGSLRLRVEIQTTTRAGRNVAMRSRSHGVGRSI